MKKIGIKLWVWIIGLVALQLVLLWLFQILFLESFYTNMKINRLQKEARGIVESVSSGGQDIQNRIDALSINNNASIIIMDKNGNAQYASTSADSAMMQMPMGRNAVITDAISQVLQGQTVTIGLTHPRFGNKFYFIGIPSGDTDFALIMNVPLAPVKDTASILITQLGYITIILFFITILFAYFLSKSLSKPILTITNAAREIAGGNYDIRIEKKSKDEIGILADTVNDMAKGLSEVEQLRRDLVANVSHELRSPLTLIRSYAETTRDVSGDDKEKRNKNLTVIIDETERLTHMVNDILNLSQLQSGGSKLNKTRFSLCEFLRETVSHYQITCEKAQIELVLNCDGDIFVMADQNRIRQVLDNLISNSISHTSPGGRILIQAKANAGSVKISVTDTGSGIPQEELPHIWDRFRKGDTPSGTGLGLSIVKEILEAHGFSFGAKSEPGQTTIWFEMSIL